MKIKENPEKSSSGETNPEELSSPDLFPKKSNSTGLNPDERASASTTAEVPTFDRLTSESLSSCKPTYETNPEALSFSDLRKIKSEYGKETQSESSPSDLNEQENAKEARPNTNETNLSFSSVSDTDAVSNVYEKANPPDHSTSEIKSDINNGGNSNIDNTDESSPNNDDYNSNNGNDSDDKGQSCVPASEPTQPNSEDSQSSSTYEDPQPTQIPLSSSVPLDQPIPTVPPTPPVPPIPSSSDNTNPKKEIGQTITVRRTGLKAWQIILICIVCALIGGIAGGIASGGVFSALGRNSDNSATYVLKASERPLTTVEAVEAESGEKMSISQIYAVYSGSVACIEVSTDEGTGAGTGFVITEDGYIVTCYHVIEDANNIVVTFPSDNSSYEATLVGGDTDEDIAVLKIETDGLTPVVLGDSKTLQVGDAVTSIGNALGTLSNTTTTGVISATDRAISMSDGSVMILLQTDCTLNAGNSGGPLFNEYGEVIGIVNAKYSTSYGTSSATSVEGIGFAIPYSNVANKVADLIEYGYITGKPYLGITVSTVTPLNAEQYNMVVGAFVNSVEPGSCAEEVGLQENDIITNVDGIDITSCEELITAKNTHSAGEEMAMEIWRNGETMTITVVLDEEKPEENIGENGEDAEDDGEKEEEPEEQWGNDNETYDDGDGWDFDDMTPEDFFNYFFGGGRNSRGENTW